MENTTGKVARPGNGLLGSQSPYLLAHAHNPVDWYPWGEEALAKAHRENKPIFLSIGYAACHWCHVMEREVFENLEIADIMNQHFINIKVDREERPDLDEIYMLATQLISGSGGWPMSVWLTPDLQPFYAGTYFPPVDGYGRPGFGRLEMAIAEAWRQRPQELRKHAETVVRAMEQHTRRDTASANNLDLKQGLNNSIEHHSTRFDATWGGFGQAPKFPPSQFLSLLLRLLEVPGGSRDGGGAMENRLGAWVASQPESKRPITMLTGTLDGMMAGGIHDQIGGGFARYSTDERWLVPHFEKMLYDNAQLAGIYARAGRLLKRADYERAARRALDFWCRNMTAPEGGFYSAMDADSEGHEGKFYVWSSQEILHIFHDTADADLITQHFGVSAAGNWEGTNVLHIAQSVESLAAKMSTDATVLQKRLDVLCAKLEVIRQQRVAPALDDKILTGWNGLMISAMAVAGVAMGERRYPAAALAALKFIMSTHVDSSGNLLRVSRQGIAGSIPGFLEDHAYLLVGITDLIRATSMLPAEEAAALPALARRLARQLMEQFYDAASGGFFMTNRRHEKLIVQIKTAQDNATPSTTALAIRGLLATNQLHGCDDYRHIIEATLKSCVDGIAQYPQAFSSLLEAVLEFGWNVGQNVQAAVPGAVGLGRSIPALSVSPESPARALLQLNVISVTRGPGSIGQSVVYDIELSMNISEGYYIARRSLADASHDEAIHVGIQGEPGLAIHQLDLPPPLRSSRKDYADDAAYRGTVALKIRIGWQATPPSGSYDVVVQATAAVCTSGYCIGDVQAVATVALVVD